MSQVYYYHSKPCQNSSASRLPDSSSPAKPSVASAAFASSADVAWLVIACDLPFLDAQTLDTLLLARDPGFDATAFRSSHDGLPEPLCAIYEPSARKAIAAQIAAGRNCPRKFLINAHTQLLDQPNPRALDNVNTVDEYERALSEFSHV